MKINRRERDDFTHVCFSSVFCFARKFGFGGAGSFDRTRSISTAAKSTSFQCGEIEIGRGNVDRLISPLLGGEKDWDVHG